MLFVIPAVIACYCAFALVLSVVIGTAIRHADEQEGKR